MYQGQTQNSKYVWNILVISARFVLLKKYTVSSQLTVVPRF